METIHSPLLGFLSVFLANNLATPEHIQKKSMLKAEPGLVTFYDIRPGNGAGLFFQPRSPQDARVSESTRDK